MVFHPPDFVPKLPDVPDSVPLCQFMTEEQYGRKPVAESWDSYVCGISGKKITAKQQVDRVEPLAQALAKEFGWKVNEGSEYDKVAGVFALNTVISQYLQYQPQTDSSRSTS